MEASHTRSLTAYIGLCAAAVVVLSQSVVQGGPGAAIARAGAPATLTIARTVTLSAASEMAELGLQVGSAVAESVAPVVGVSAPLGKALAAPVTASRATHAGRSVAAAPVVELKGAHGGALVGSHAARKADRQQAKAEHAQRKADAKASRAEAKAEKRSAKAAGKPGKGH